MGNGTTAIATEKLGLHWNGIELKPEYARKTVRRIGVGSLPNFKFVPYILVGGVGVVFTILYLVGIGKVRDTLYHQRKNQQRRHMISKHYLKNN